MSQRFSNLFFELGMSVEDTSEFLSLMGVTAMDVRDNDKLLKLRTIAEFVKDIPNKGRFFTRITKAEKVDMIDFMYEYCTLRLTHEGALRNLKETEEMLARSPEDTELAMKWEELQRNIADINETLDVYER